MIKRVLSALALSGLALTTMSDGASAQGFSLGAAYPFAVLIDNNSTAPTLGLNGSTVNGAVGFAASSSTSPGFGTGTVKGNVDYSGSAPSSTGGTQNAIVANVGSVASAVSNLTTLSGTYSGGTALTFTSGNATATAGATPTVYSANNFSLGSSNTLTISGAANTYVVFNLTGTSATFNGTVVLTGGISSSHVLFNDAGSTAISGTNGVINGVIVAPTSTVTFTGEKVNGLVFASSGSSLTNSVVTAPEPASMAVMGVALGGLAYVRRTRRRRA